MGELPNGQYKQLSLQGINYMASLLEQYNDLSKDQQSSLGQVSSRIRTAGCHLVEIDSMFEIDGNRVKIDFKDATGATVDYTGFLETKDKDGNVIPNSRTLNQLTFICNAIGLDLGSVLARGKATTLDFKKGTVDATEFPSVKGKKLYVTTTTEVEVDNQNPDKVYVKQALDPYKFFDSKKRNALEIASKADEGVTMEAADLEAKAKMEVAYKSQGNPAAEAKLLELQERAGVNSGASTVGQIQTNAAATAVPQNADDI